MKPKIIISGINGFLGNRLQEFLAEDFHIYGIAKNESKSTKVKIFSSNSINNIKVEPEFLILCHAAVSSGTTNIANDLLYEVNVKLTEEIISKFSSSKIIYISSASIYNSEGGIITESTNSSPINDYAISKYWAEKVLLKTKKATIIRLSSMYGINMKENTIIPNYVNQALKAKCIEVWGEGKRQQNYIFIDDVCSLVKKTIKNFDKVKNEFVLAVNNKEYSNLDLAKIISEETNSTIKFIKQDNSISLKYNNTKTRNALEWTPVSCFKQEIINYIKWKQK